MKCKPYLFGTLLLLAGCGASGGQSSGNFSAASQSSLLPVDENPALLAPTATSDRLLVDDEPATLDLLANDTQKEARVRPFSTVGSAGGQAVVSETGLLSYTPPPGNAPFVETFEYTLENSAGSSRATVTAQRSRTVYVRNNVNNGNGSKGSPFNNLQAALRSVGIDPAQIFVFPGDGSNKGLDLPVVTLVPGQHIQGTDASHPPVFTSHFELASHDCSLVNMEIVGTGTGPLIRMQGNFFPNPSTPKLVLSNLILRDHAGDGIQLFQPADTELTGVQALRLNQSEGSAALVVTNPWGLVKASKWTVNQNSRGAVRVENTAQAPSSGAVPVVMNGIQLAAVTNAAQVQASSGKLNFFLLGVSCSSNDLSGSLIGSDISGDATVDALVNDVDLRNIGLNAAVLDWVYRQTSNGTLRMGAAQSNADPKPGANNPLRFYTRDLAQGSYCTSDTKLNQGNPVNLEAFDGSLIKTRIQRYSFKILDPIQHPLTLYAHDHAQTYARMRDGLYYGPIGEKVVYKFIWRRDYNAAHRIERLQEIAPYVRDIVTNEPTPVFPQSFDNPDSTWEWNGWEGTSPVTYVNQLTMLRLRAPNYSPADLDELGIPRYEGFPVP